MARVNAIVLAAGLSSRMEDAHKLFLPWQGKTIIETVIDSVLASNVYEIVLVVSELSEDRLLNFRDSRVTITNNHNYRKGMTSSIQAGIEAAGDADGYMICLGDQPLVTTDDYNAIIEGFSLALANDHKTIAVPFFDGRKGNPAIFSSHYKDEILSHAEPEGCKSIIKKHGDSIVEIDLNNSGILKDIDTKADYKKLRR